METTELKKKRGQKKGALTRLRSKIARHISENDKEELVKCMDDIKREWKVFEDIHVQYHDKLEEENDLDESEDYILKVEKDYTDALTAANQWIKSCQVKQDEPTDTKAKEKQEKQSTQSTLSAEVVSALHLPKLELFVYDGNPLQYYPFFTVFDETVDSVALTGAAKLSRLISYTSGDAREAIDSYLIIGGEKGYQLARRTMKERFGNDLIISRAIIDSLSSSSPVKTATELRKLADELSRSSLVLTRLGTVQEVESQRFIASVVDRLQPFRKQRWRKLALEKKKKDKQYPGFAQLVDFVCGEADTAEDPVYGDSGLLKFGSAGFKQSSGNAGFKQSSGNAGFKQSSSNAGFKQLSSSQPRSSQSTTLATSEGRPVRLCAFCNENHRLFWCTAFKSLKPEQRFDYVVAKKLCENCLLDNHDVEQCFRPSMCGVDGCSQKHSKLIHECKVSSASVNSVQSAQDEPSNIQLTTTFTQSHSQVCIPVVEVRVNNMCDSAALLDSCSTTTFCTEKLVDELGLSGVPVAYQLSTLTSENQSRNTKVIPTMFVESKCEGHSFRLSNVFVIDHIPSCESQVEVGKYEHLSDIDVVASSGRVDILIGQDNAEALVPLEVRRGRLGEPYAIKTVLGWSLHGNTDSQADKCGLVRAGRVSTRVVSNFIQSDVMLDRDRLDRLEDQVDRLWKVDQEGLASQDMGLSCEEDEVLRFWDEHVNFVEGHYELPIPWKQGVQVPDNFELAQSRLKSLRSSLVRRGIVDWYDAEVQKLLDKSYAEPVRDSKSQNSSSKIWYLPHHGVISDKKPGKLRVVFDCAARYQGESLNDKCKQGPDLNNKLVHVLLRFRQHELAIMGDVEAMYYQVKVSEKDRDALRFLWVDSEGEEVVYRMNAHIFGGVWCACIATYAMRRTLQDQEVEDEFVRDVISRSFYVDDCLSSVSSLEEAEKVVVDVRKVLKKGGFNLTKFVANDEKILENIPEEDRAKEVKDFENEVVSKALGVNWDVKKDEFKVTVGLKLRREVTRKIMLSTIASMYDPLGLVSPWVITGKMLFQDATRLKLDWDEEVPSHIARKWLMWLEDLAELSEVSFPRCMKLKGNEDVTYEVHTFSDASQRGFGCCSYLRSISKNGEVHVSLIMSKGRVCPMKQVTIPRLELQAALLAVQMNEVICRELDLPIAQSYFWVDSQIVLAYIKNKTKKLKVYVANRVSMIHSLSEVEQWKFVPGEKNVADLISRGARPSELNTATWKEGPSFLKQLDVEQVEVCHEIPSGDEEVKKEVIVNVALENEEHPVEKIVKYFSSWYKVKKSIAWWLKLKGRLIEKVKGRRKEVVTVEDLRDAEKIVVKYVQRQKFEQEVKKLKSGSVVQKSSSIRSLLPMLDEDGILCVGGRLKHAKSQVVCKHPYILPHDHQVVKLIAREYHEKAHQGTEWTLSLLRQKYWITRCRGILKQVRKECVVCKKLFDQPKNQQMADLPAERTEVVKPFEHVGIDCFGPFYVKQGRSEVKKYGCIFTCMNIRAVHIEKLNSLETDSFINGFRRFMARRGTPAKVWSDNGTNFIGASPELMKCLQSLDEEKIRKFGLEKEVEWNFNPPKASHMGGVWERQIRTVRKILSSLLNKHADKLTDEVLETFFCEVEAMINSRPLTKLSEDVTDMTTLNPNQLLMLNEQSRNFPGRFQKSDMYRQRWKFIQYLANQFWKRWLKEYLPELQRRSKWCARQENIKVGDVVLLCEENTPRFLWPLGLVIQVKEGRDKLIRTVKVKTKSTVLVRPVSKVVKIEG